MKMHRNIIWVYNETRIPHSLTTLLFNIQIINTSTRESGEIKDRSLLHQGVEKCLQNQKCFISKFTDKPI